jgi:hypothetical protein
MNTSNSSYPVVAGVLSIVSGALGVIMSAVLILFAVVFWSAISISTDAPEDFPFFIFQTIYLVWGIGLLILAVLGIIGGIFALQRRYWGLALTGSIAAVLTFLPAGVIAVIFVALAKQEFK